MNLHLIQNAETVETHKNLIRRSRYLEFEFHSLFLNLGDFIAPYFEQNVIPSNENGYKDFLPKLETLLNHCREANLQIPVVNNFLDYNNLIFDKDKQQDFTDFAMFRIIHDFFSGIKRVLTGLSLRTKGIIKEVDDFIGSSFNKNNENITGVDTEVFAYTIRKQVRSNIARYEKWLGNMPVLPENPTAEDLESFKEDIEYLQKYINSLVATRNEVKENLDTYVTDILANDKGIILGERMVEILEQTNLNSLSGSKYHENVIPYSHIERAVIARSYSDLMFRGIGRSLEKAVMHQDRIAYLQYFLEKEICGDNVSTRSVDNTLIEIQKLYEAGSDGTEEGNKKFDTIAKEYHKQMNAYAFAETHRSNTTPYSESLNAEHKHILALVTAIYKEFGYAIYHNPRYIEHFSAYRLRLSSFFVYQYPNSDLLSHKATKPFHFGDGVIERHVLESLCNLSFDPLTFSDIIGILDKKYRKSVELMTTLKEFKHDTSKVIAGFRSTLEALNELPEKSKELQGIANDLKYTTNRLERVLNTAHDKHQHLRSNNN